MTRWVKIFSGIIKSRCLVVWLLTLISSTPATATVVAESVQGIDLLRFSWTGSIKYSAQRFGNSLVVEFSNPIRGDVASEARKLGKFVASATADSRGREVVINLTGPHRFQTQKHGNEIVILVGDRDAIATKILATEAGKTVAKSNLSLPVRVGKHSNYERLVFDWPQKTSYDLSQKEGFVRIRFERNAKIDESSIRKRLSGKFKNFRTKSSPTGGLEINIQLPDRFSIRHFISGTKVVVDLIKKSNQARSQKQKISPNSSLTSKKDENVETKSKKGEGISEEKPKDELAAKFGLVSGQRAIERKVKKSFDENQERVAPQKKPINLDQKNKSKLKSLKTDITKPKKPIAAIAVAISSANASEVLEKSEKKDEIVDIKNDSDRARLSSNIAQPSSFSSNLTANLRALEDATISGPRLPVRLAQNEDVTSVRFEWSTPVPAAVFRRAGFLWVVFDLSVTFNFIEGGSSRGKIMGRPQQIAVAGGSALRIPLVAGIAPSVWRDENTWVVDLQPQAMRPDVGLTVQTQHTSPHGPRLFVLGEGIGRSVIVHDPEVGDQIFVVPLSPLSRGVDGKRQFGQLTILPSVQGLVVQPLIDQLEVRIMPDGIAISSSKLRGLEISKVISEKSKNALVNYRTDGLPPGLAPGRIFNLVTWRQGAGPADFLNMKQLIQRKISEATTISRSVPRLSLAQFYFSKGLSAEAMGILRIIANSDEELARRPAVRALRGACQFTLGRFPESEEDLDHRSLNGFAETELWRGAASAAQGKWAKAIEHFARAGEIPGDYPRNFATQLALLAAEAAIRAEDFRGAGSFLDAIAEGRPTAGEQARLNYLRGRVLYASADINTALNYWRRLADGSDRWSRVRSKRALIEHSLREMNITKTEAIEQLERLRFAWRGDQLEFDLLRRLGNLYLEENDFVAGLKSMRQAVVFFPNNIFAREVTKELTNHFAKIYTDGTSDSMTPLSALSLYDQFRELTPVGKRGDLIIQRLADRLVEVDLLDRAAILLDRQVRFRLQGSAKARVGGRLALIRLLDRQPEKALEALDESVAPGLKPDLSLQRKRLRSRSVFELGDSETALKLLKTDESADADLLRADVYWRTQEWEKASKVFERLIGRAGQDGRRINDQVASLVLNWSVTLAMSDQISQLNKVRQIFMAQMDNSRYREAFRLITNKTEGDLSDFSTLTNRFQEIGRFQAFLSSYREKLKTKPLSAFN